MLDQSTIDRIMDTANIVDVVSDYVTLRRSGASYKGLCPFHDDKTPSFYVNPARGICKCFSCGKGGNVVHFIMEEEQLGYYDALRFLAKRYGIEVREKELTNEERQSQSERESMFVVNEWASHYFHDSMLNTEDGRDIGLAYFRSRGFRDDIIEKFRLGFCPDTWNSMSKAALAKGFKSDFLVATGLSSRRDNGGLIDKFRGRVIFPWFNQSGRIVGFGGRVLDARTKGVNQKYLNSPASAIYDKSRELFGIFQAKKQIARENQVFMVEGYTDVIAMHQCGVENVVANSGTALTGQQVRMLHRLATNITLLYDGDEAGIHAALRGTDMFLSEGMSVKVLLLPDGQDPDEFARSHSAGEFKAYVGEHQTDFILFKIRLLKSRTANDPLKRAELINDILQSICVIPDEIVRTSYIHECSELMEMDEGTLLRQCNKKRREYVERQRQEREREAERKKRETERSLPVPPPDVQQTEVEGLLPPPEDPPAGLPPADVPDEPAMSSRIPVPPPPQEEGERLVVRPSDSKLIGIERLLIREIVRHGEQKVRSFDAAGQAVDITLADFVNHELEEDHLELHSPLYARMLREALSRQSVPGFRCAHYFVHHADPEISKEASDLLADRYRLDKDQTMPDEENYLGERISHIMLDYKFEVVRAAVGQLQKQLGSPEVLQDADRLMQVMQDYAHLSDVKRQIAERLGERIM